MINEKELLQEVKTDLVENSGSLGKTYTNGILVANNERIEFLPSEGTTRFFITYIPYDHNGENIDLRIRKRLAKEFIENYSLEQLQKEYEGVIEKENKQAEQDEKKYKETLALYEELKTELTDFSKSDVKAYYSGIVKSEIICEYNYRDYTYRYENKSEQVKIQIHDTEYKIIHCFSDGYVCKENDYSADSTKGIIESVSKALAEIKQREQEANNRIKAQHEKENRESSIRNILSIIARHNETGWYILKSKKTYTAISGNTKYSLTSGYGKYMKPNYQKILEDILNGKIEGYVKVDADRASTVDFKNMEYIAF